MCETGCVGGGELTDAVDRWENLLYVLGEHQARCHVYLGRHIRNLILHGYTSGGAGYLISKPAVRKLVNEGPKFPANCSKDGAIEDLDVGRYVVRNTN